MVINKTSTTSSVEQTSSEQDQDNSSFSRFNINAYQNKDPKDITFEEYQALTKENIANLFPKDEQREFYDKAVSLHTKANATDDAILNQVMFEIELNSTNSEFDQKTSYMLNSIIDSWQSIEKFQLSIQKTDEYIQNNNIKFEGDIQEWIGEYSHIHSQIYKEIIVPEHQKTISKDELFSVFKHNLQGAETLIEYYKYTPNDAPYQYLQSMIQYEENIKIEYEKKVQENQALLASYTKTTNSAQNNINSTQEEQSSTKTEQTEQSYATDTTANEEKDRISILRELVEDIKSILRTGFTQDELEHLEKLIAEIKKLMDEKNSNNDNDIASKIKKLEEAILALQKKIGGVAIIELEDDHTTNPTNEKETNTILDPLGFQSKLDALQKTLEKIKSGALKDKEQFDMAMKEHGLNPNSDIDVLILEFIQKGYTKEVARERAYLYRDAGLISNHREIEEKFGIKVHHLGFTSFNPEYKQASKEAFDKMDLETLKGVVSTIGSSDVFSIDIEDAIRIMPRDGSRSHEEIMKGWEQYWDNRYGNEGNIDNLFNKILEHHKINQKFTTEDLSYIEEGILLLQETYNNFR